MLPLFFILYVGFFGLSEGAGVLPDGPLDAAIGDSVLFNTNMTPPETPFFAVSWTFGATHIGFSFPSGENIAPEYQGRVRIFHSTGSLELSSLTAADSGEYGVSISPASGPVETGTTTLRVHAPVSNVAIDPKSVNLVEFTDSLKLSCSSSGSSLSFLWIKDGSNVTASDRVQITDGGKVLTIVNVTRDDQGNYTCEVSNPVSNATSDPATVSVYSPVSNVTIDPKTVNLVEFNDSLNLSCSSSGSSLSFLWIKDGSEVTARDRVQITDGGKVLTIVKVTRDDQGNYTCEVSNPASSATSDPATVTVYYGPENVKLTPSPDVTGHEAGSNIKMVCSADYRPSAQFTWFLNRVQLLVTGSELQLMDVKVNQSGSYSCQAFNPETLRYQTSELSVINIHENISGASVEPTNPPVEGKSLNLTCEASGSVLSRKWMKDGSDLTLTDNMKLYDNNRVLSFTTVTRNDKGEYVCNLSNSNSNVKVTYSLIVNYGPEDVKISGENKIKIGSTINLTCTADSVPLAEFTWLLNNTEIFQSSGFNKHNAKVSDSGTYTCKATNNITGTSESAEHKLSVTANLEQGPDEPSDCTAGCIAGIVIACLVVIAAVMGVGYYCFQKKKKTKKSASTTVGGGAQGNPGYTSEEVNYADIGFFRNNKGESVNLGLQNTSTDYAEVRVNNNRPAPSSPPSYDAHIERAKRTDPQHGGGGGR